MAAAVALTVVLLEITNDLVFLLPIMVSIGVAKAEGLSREAVVYGAGYTEHVQKL